ncbi:hypothetical protein AB0M80_29165 [Amycolatopsis sp. NPDC051045]|uniref:hypothetical protein n=1 Tax=Amycolatopsis sp. NPDC051045 TaxID=3156922 RepID=UPI003421CDC3
MADTLAEFGIMTPHETRATPESTLVVDRILAAEDTDEADLQIKYETLIAIYKVKRLLVWVLVIVPLSLVGLGVFSYAVSVR